MSVATGAFLFKAKSAISDAGSKMKINPGVKDSMKEGITTIKEGVATAAEKTKGAISSGVTATRGAFDDFGSKIKTTLVKSHGSIDRDGPGP